MPSLHLFLQTLSHLYHFKVPKAEVPPVRIAKGGVAVGIDSLVRGDTRKPESVVVAEPCRFRSRHFNVLVFRVHEPNQIPLFGRLRHDVRGYRRGKFLVKACSNGQMRYLPTKSDP